MKKFIVLIWLMVMLIGCQQEPQITTEDYERSYSDLLMTIEQSLEQNIYTELADMLNFNGYETLYSHKDFVHYLDQLISDIDNTLYELSILGPQVDDVEILKYQSKLEFALLDLMNTFKEYRSHETFNVLVPSQFTLYTEMYHLLDDLSPLLTKVHKYQLSIETRLSELGSPVQENYLLTKHHNMYRFAYSYFIIGSQVSTYQDFSGLQVNPRYSNIVQTSSGDWYTVAELDSSVMINLRRKITTYLELINMNKALSSLYHLLRLS